MINPFLIKLDIQVAILLSIISFWKGGYLGNFFKNMGKHVYISNYSEHFELFVKFWGDDTL